MKSPNLRHCQALSQDKELYTENYKDGDPSREGSLNKREVSKQREHTLTAKSVASLGTSEGKITGRKNK